MGNEVGLVRVGPSCQLVLWILCIEALAGGALLHPSSASEAEGVGVRQGDGSRNGTTYRDYASSMFERRPAITSLPFAAAILIAHALGKRRWQ